MVYSFFRKILFCLDPEVAHAIALNSLQFAQHFCSVSPQKKNITIMGLDFPNPIGLAAGLDKNGDYIDGLASLGFGFIEVGTTTPLPQPGNPKPRMFRVPEYQALINRLGFNNKGLDYLIKRLEKTKFKGVLGINVGKNHFTPIEKAHEDYLIGFRKVAPFASYVTINISSPNTEGLRDLQQSEWLQPLLSVLKKEQEMFFAQQKKYVPLVVKISPDLTEKELTEMAEIFLAEKIDGVIATNTTIDHETIKNSRYAKEAGGVSGKPLTKQSTQIIRILHTLVQDKIPIIGCGGIFSKEDVADKIFAGASLVQVYTGLIYQGPGLIRSLM